MNICACGCGNECQTKFLKGHFNKGKTKFLSSSLANVSLKMIGNKNGIGNRSRIGRVSWNKGLTKETDSRMMSVLRALMGHPVSEKNRKTLSNTQTGKKWSKERKESHSLSLIGRKVSADTRRKIGEKNQVKAREKWLDIDFYEKVCAIHKKRWCDEKWKELQLEKMARGLKNRPTKPEEQLISIFKNLFLSFEYVGDCSFFVVNINPDFVDFNTKMIIEFQGCYWHGCEKHKPGSNRKNDFYQRYEIYKSVGYDAIEIWEHELDDVEALQKKLLMFQLYGILKDKIKLGDKKC